MAYLRLTDDRIAETELKYGIRLSSFERWAVQNLGEEKVEIICRYELFKLRLSAEEKNHKLESKLKKVDKDSREFNELEYEIDFLKRQINLINEKLA